MYWEVGIKIDSEAGQVTVHPAALEQSQWDNAMEHALDMAQDVAGIFLDHMHKALGAELRRKNKRDVIIDVGTVEAYNLRDLARGKGGRPKKEVA